MNELVHILYHLWSQAKAQEKFGCCLSSFLWDRHGRQGDANSFCDEVCKFPSSLSC